jgi:hypothetical protein
VKLRALGEGSWHEGNRARVHRALDGRRLAAARCAALASVSPLAAVSAWVRERPTKRAQRAAWDRYRVAGEVVDDARRAFGSAPNPVTADQLRCAEIAYVDAIAIAGEFEVMNLPWEIPGLSNAGWDAADSDCL